MSCSWFRCVNDFLQKYLIVSMCYLCLYYYLSVDYFCAVLTIYPLNRHTKSARTICIHASYMHDIKYTGFILSPSVLLLYKIVLFLK